MKRKFNNLFQIRWREAIGLVQCPYVYRWTLLLFGFSLRVHHWLKSDDRRHFHDHACNLLTIPISGRYLNVMPGKEINGILHPNNEDVGPRYFIEAKPFIPRFMKATQLHYLEIPKGGIWSVTLFGRPYKKWGFYVNGHMWRPLRYFHKFGIIQDEAYQ